jgi:ATP-binding cassette subfamily B (MDR/TAP) protein 1
VSTVLTISSQFLFHYSAHRISSSIKSACFNSLLRQEIGYFDVKKLGSITNVISEDVNKITGVIAQNLQSFLMYSSQFILGFALAFGFGWQMALLQATCIPILLVILVILGMIVENTATKISLQTAESVTTANEVINAIRTVRSMAGERKELNRYFKDLDKLQIYGWINAIARAVSAGSANFMFWSSLALAFWYSGNLIVWGLTESSTIFSVFGYALMALIAFGQLFSIIPELIKSIVSAKLLLKIIMREPEIRFRGGVTPEVKGSIEFKDVKFRYPSRPNTVVLESFNLTIEPGTSVALVGPSGSGKSTVVGILERWYDIEHGSVIIDGTDIREWDPVYLHRCLGLVSQEPLLFSTTIKRNITYAVDTINQRILLEGEENGLKKEEIQQKLIPVSEEIIIQAAKAANAHEFISELSAGYDTVLGERGITLSGGQKQRIAIARAILQDPKILLLDEATSALDTQSESLVQEALDKLRMNRTSIVIAHRLSTIQNCDKIVVVKSGEVVETGTHTELIDQKGLYYTLAAKQITEQKNEEPEEVAEIQVAIPEESVVVVAALLEPSPGAAITTTDINNFTNEKEIVDVHAAKIITSLPILKYMKWNWLSVIGQCAAFVSGSAQLIVFLLVGYLIDAITPGRNMDGAIVPFPPGYSFTEQTAKYAGYIVIVGAVAGVSSLIDNFMSTFSNSQLTISMKKKLFHAVVSQDIGYFDIRKSGKILSTLSDDITNVNNALTFRLSVFTQNMSMFLVSIVLSFFASWELTLVVLAAAVPAFGLVMFIAAIIDDILNRKLTNIAASSLMTVTEVIGSIRTVRSMAGEEREMKRFENDLKKQNRVGLLKALTVASAFGGFDFSSWAITALAFWYGGKMIAQGRVSVGVLVQITGYLYFAMIGIMMAMYELQHFFKANTSSKEILKITERKPQINITGGKKVENFSGTVEFNSVSFAYPSRPNTTILDEFSLHVPSGKKVALVGESGSGKSTIAALVERFYDPQSGNVSLDGLNLKEWDPEELHKVVSIVMQEPHLFAGSILSNITYTLNGPVDMDKIIQVAKDANCHDFISKLPEGYDTVVGDRGISLSGGQKQRIAIARAMLQGASVLLLDEATSALDTESEALVQQALTTLMAGKTTIIIAHRLSTIQDCDEIIVMRKGRIVERGTHDELVKMQGKYHNLVQKQMDFGASPRTI